MDKGFKISVILSAYDKMTTIVNGAVDKVERKLKSVRKGLDTFGNASLIGGGIATAYFATTIKAAEESQIAGNRLKQVFKSMGEANDNAANSALNYASQLQMQIGVEDEVIAATQAKIATFKSVSNEAGRMAGIFDRATAAAFDMQATGFGDAAGNAVQLGKALEDPIKGITALRKSGITFTEAERKKIQVLVDGNRKLDAQKIILGAIEKQVGGVAAATAPASKKMSVAFGEIGETVGKALLPTVEKFANYATGTLIPKVQAFIEQNPKLVKVLGAVAVALVVVGTAAKALSVILAVNPIILIITAIAAAATLIYVKWDGIKAWFQGLWDKVTAVFNKFVNFIKKLFLNFTPAGLIYKNWGKITSFFSGLWDKVKAIFSNFWEGIKNFLLNYTPMGLIYKHWDQITAYFSNLWESVKDIFSNVWQWIEEGAKRMYEAGKNILKNLWKGVKEAFGAGDDPLEATISKYQNTLNAAQRVGLNGTVTSNVNYNQPFGATAGLATALKPAAVNNNSSAFHYAPVINYSGPGGATGAAEFNAAVKSDWEKQQQAFLAKQQRVSFNN